MSRTEFHPWLYRLAMSTVCVALVTVIAGALVTSKNAGMAFRDWPTSDGRAMLSYPWLGDFAHDWDKFLEHGHRLAGMLIGLWSIGLAVAVTWVEQRRWVRFAAWSVLLGVICQGVLGGFRVWFDQRGLAMLHGVLAACVFSLMAIVATSLSRRWLSTVKQESEMTFSAVQSLAFASTGILAMQYLFGGMIRHRGTGLHEHLGMGILAMLVILANAIVAQRSGVSWIRNSGWMLLGAVLLQASLGAAAWLTKFGFGVIGYVAVADSIQQIVFRTAHTVLGIVVMMTSVVHLVRVQRVVWEHRLLKSPETRGAATGGVA